MLTTKELGAAFGVSRQTIQTWKRKGCPHTEQAQADGRGRPSTMWDAEKVKQWLLASGQKNAANRVQTPQARGATKKAEEPAPAIRPSAKPQTTAEEVEQLKQHTVLAERAAFQAWVKARNSKAEVSHVSILHKSWQEAQHRCRLLLKDYPDMMAKLDRYRDTAEVNQALVVAAQVWASAMDQLGSALAERLVGLTADQIKLEIDREVAVHRAQMLEAIEAMK